MKDQQREAEARAREIVECWWRPETYGIADDLIAAITAALQDAGKAAGERARCEHLCHRDSGIEDCPACQATPADEPPADAAGQRGEMIRLHRMRLWFDGYYTICSNEKTCGHDEHRLALLLPEGDGAGKEKA